MPSLVQNIRLLLATAMHHKQAGDLAKARESFQLAKVHVHFFQISYFSLIRPKLIYTHTHARVCNQKYQLYSNCKIYSSRNKQAKHNRLPKLPHSALQLLLQHVVLHGQLPLLVCFPPYSTYKHMFLINTIIYLFRLSSTTNTVPIVSCKSERTFFHLCLL